MENISAAVIEQNFFSQMAEKNINRLQIQASDPGSKTEKQLQELSGQFESFFIFQLFKSMRKTVPKSGMLNSFSVDMYESMFDQELANELSKSKGIGLSKMIFDDLTRLQRAVEKKISEQVPSPGQQ